uniref:SBP-type domain-containing protein n=1 Tax=Tetradesmus obliquus TaxID=3088 RepID=A0A383W517_TETOB|eukprot:jgi/Sobl393_1/12078/SZX72283.1
MKASSLGKVVGCCVDLSALGKPYCLKRRVCPEHLKAAAVQCKGAGAQMWRFCQQCGRMEPLQCFEGANRSCRQGLARRRAKNASKQQAAGQKSATRCGCAQLAPAAAQHTLPHLQQQQQQREQMMTPISLAFAWQPQAGWAPAEAAAHCAMQPRQNSLLSQGSGTTANLSGEMFFSPDIASCGDTCGSLDSLVDAELEALIERELRAAAVTPCEAAAGGGYTASMMQQVPAAMPPPGAVAAPAAAGVPAMDAAAAQHAKLLSLMAEYAELSAALQQLQQDAGVLRQADSGSVTTSFFY